MSVAALFSRISIAPSIKSSLLSNSSSINTRCLTSLINQQFSTPNRPTTFTNNTINITNTSNHHIHSPSFITPPTHQFSTHHRSQNKNTPKPPPSPILATGPDGTKYLIPPQPLGPYRLARNAPKLAPSLTSRRLSKLRTSTGKLRNVRHSPWRLNLVCRFAASLPTVEETVLQLDYTEKVMAGTVKKLIEGVADNARVKHGLVKTQLEVAECFSTRGTPLKRIEFMGRGRLGRKEHRHSHIRVVLREIDFPLKIIQAKTNGERENWVRRMKVAERDYEESRVDGEELERLEREVKEMQRAKQQKEEEEQKGKK